MILHPEDIHYIFLVDPNTTPPQRKMLAKYSLTNGKLSVLEDHGLGQNLESMTPERQTQYLKHLANAQRTEVVSLHDILQGHHEHSIKTIEDHINPGVQQHDALKLKYHHPLLGARDLEIEGNSVYLDGHKLSDEEVELVMAHAKSGGGKISHTNSVSLEKSQPELYEALGNLKTAVAAGSVQPEIYKILSRHIFKDTMIPSVGNKLAYQDFLSRPRDGFHIHIDMNSFGKINKLFGFEAGDLAIKAVGNIVRKSVDESVGRKLAKCWRPGGDELVVHVGTFNQAQAFVRVFKKELQNYTFSYTEKPFTASIGVGNTAQAAEQALMSAKQNKLVDGQEVTSAYSFVESDNPYKL